jgi:hypothetical protein
VYASWADDLVFAIAPRHPAATQAITLEHLAELHYDELVVLRAWELPAGRSTVRTRSLDAAASAPSASFHALPPPTFVEVPVRSFVFEAARRRDGVIAARAYLSTAIPASASPVSKL